MTRDQFREQTFARDNHTCVVPGCNKAAVDAHHILDRALWLASDPHPEGYHPANGASLCETHHRHAENNAIPPQALRRWLNLPTVLPRQLAADKIWDKWGEEVPSPPNAKYPRTPYLPFSPTAEDDTAALADFVGKPLVVTTKMDGANVTLTRDKVAARNGETAHHPSFNPLKARHAAIKYLIPEHVTVYAEWLYAAHSIHYTGALTLDDHLVVLQALDTTHHLFLPHDELKELAATLGAPTAPELARVTLTEEWRLTRDVYDIFSKVVAQGHEGVVVKTAHPFHPGQFRQNVAKMVRENHNQTPPDWKQREVTRNYRKPTA